MNIKQKAARAVIRGMRTPGTNRSKNFGRMTPEEKRIARQRIQEVGESPVFEYAEARRRPVLPSPEEQKRLRQSQAARDVMRFAMERGRKGRLSPEAKEGIRQQVESLSSSPLKMGYGHHLETSFVPTQLRRDLETASALKERSTLALVDGTWYDVNHVKGRKTDDFGDPATAWFFGLGQGYDITRFLVYSDRGEAAIEIAEDAWPRFFFSEIRAASSVPEEEQDDWQYIESLGKLGKPEEDVRIFNQAEEVAHHAVPLGNSLYRLTDGRVVEVH
jgi:hypothetical protein